jgi:hypothetical protein
MQTNPRPFASGTITSFLVPAMLSLSTAQAADPVQWTDLSKKIGHGKIRSDNREDRQYRVITKDGLTYTGYKLLFNPRDVSLSESGPTIPREQVKEIRIHHDGRFRDALVAPAGAMLRPFFCDYCLSGIFLAPAIIPVAFGATAVAAPVTLPIEGIKRLLPDRVVNVAP